jgi:23S rRNA-/tRNA-specific pseudouridylate synthase
MRQQPLKQRQESPLANVKNIVEETKLSLQSSSGGKQVAEVGRRAISFVDTKAFDGKLAFVEVRIPTGRTHQIRVHLQDRGTPVYGDETYGLMDWNKKLRKRSGNIARPLLHALELELDHHPMVSIDARVDGGNDTADGVNSKKLRFRAPLPQDMAMVSDSIWPQGRVERPDYFNPQKAED